MGTSYWSEGLRVLSQSFLMHFIWNPEDTLTSLLISKLHFLNLMQVNQKGYDRVFLSCLIGMSLHLPTKLINGNYHKK